MEKKLLIKSTAGLHASLASKVVQLSTKYDCEVKLLYKDRIVDAKSILGLMSLAIPQGENITLRATGKDAEKVLEDVTKILG